MIHVPDVGATINWYVSIGFELLGQNEDDGALDWASLSFGDSEVMLNAGGRASTAPRREVDLYIRTDRVEDLYNSLKERVQIVEDLHDSFYGMREFIVRDINGFWITFGQEAPHE
jgi:uncharacterized glyoxalase superfamily protein PhnB